MKAGKVYIYKSSGQKLIIKPFGSVDYQKGIIKFIFPEFAVTVLENFGNSGIISFSSIPLNADIESYLQNIIRIGKIRVFFKDA